ncbi:MULTISPECIES: hypothetical protein [unclassified Exiguobacterium]|uniref:hypothetical protein n=1 Tax=unclassified Exiguobacterium TaxID=2644629 RepID=UPI001BECC85A|nr:MULTISPECIES: hypothetical protein [unclassified Exiguobacterium]
MRIRFVLALCLVFLSGCAEDPEPVRFSYVPDLYDTLNVSDFKSADPKLGSLIQEVCHQKKVKPPKQYTVGDHYYVSLVNIGLFIEGTRATYIEADGQPYLYCDDMRHLPTFHSLTKKQKSFSTSALKKPVKKIEIKNIDPKNRQLYSHLVDHVRKSQMQLTLPTTGYLVIRATNDQTKETTVTNVMELTPFAHGIPHFVFIDKTYMDDRHQIRPHLLTDGINLLFEAPIIEAEKPVKVRFTPAEPNSQGEYGSLQVTTTSGERSRYTLTVRQESELPPGIKLLPDDDDSSESPHHAVFHDRPFPKVDYTQKTPYDELSEQEFLMTSVEEMKTLTGLIKQSQVAEKKGKLAERSYLTLFNGDQAQQYRIYLDRRVKKTDIYLEDRTRKISFKLTPEARNLLLDSYQIN